MRGVASVAVFLVAAAVAAQFGETIEVRLHQIEVIVETKAGVPVTNLTKDDFVVRQDGVVQAITNFSINVDAVDEVPRPAPQAEKQTALPEVRKREDRRYVFFIDEAPLHDLARADFLRQSASLLNAMAPGDEAMVITPATRKQIQLRFTPDRNLVQKKLEEVTLAMMRLEDVAVVDFAPLPGLIDTGPPNEVQDPFFRRGDCGQSAAQCSENRIAALRAVVRTLGALPGRKALILLSRRISSDPTWSLAPASTEGGSILTTGKNVRPLVDEVARLAAANNVMIYSIEPYEPGHEAMGGVVADSRLTQTPSPIVPTRGDPGVLDALKEISETTGGRLFNGTQEFDDLFGQIVSDQSFYYSLGFPDRGKAGAGHKVAVEVKNRPDLVVRARRHVVAKSQHDESRDKALSALLSQKPRNVLGIHVTIEPLKKAGRSSVDIPVTIRIPLGRLTMVRQGPAYRGSFNVYVAAQDSEKLELGDSNQKNTQEVVIPAEKWSQAQRGYFTYETALRVKKGTYRISIGVTDTPSGETGFQTFDVDART